MDNTTDKDQTNIPSSINRINPSGQPPTGCESRNLLPVIRNANTIRPRFASGRIRYREQQAARHSMIKHISSLQQSSHSRAGLSMSRMVMASDFV
ncbi:ABC transporter-like protein [Anopheles sinensis]|uniref:ABC transporter-like protein n=1 Tax=Anopheles sinensis TaxID=74873 RepID=A0A084WRQ0_ANOSI|nr:ABC transporter-like protein [Anopheles sinensis]